MHRIDGQDVGPGDIFQPGNTTLGLRPTEVTADWLTAVQEEISNAVEAVGLTLNKVDNGQLAEAIYLLAGSIGVGRNLLINGGFDIKNRPGTFAQFSPGYSIDRWRFNAGIANSRVVTLEQKTHTPGQVAVPGDPEYFVEWSYAAGGTNGSHDPRLEQRIENAWMANGQTVTVSWFARVTAGTSTITPALEQNFGSGGDASVVVAGTPTTVTTVWQRFQQVFDLPSTAGKTFGTKHYLELRLATDPTYDVVAGKFQASDIQTERGRKATAFERRRRQDVLLQCARYCESSTSGGTFNSFASCARGYDAGSIAEAVNTRFRTTKLEIPAVTWFNPNGGTAAEVFWNSGNRAVTTTDSPGVDSTGAPSITAGQPASHVYAHWLAESEL